MGTGTNPSGLFRSPSQGKWHFITLQIKKYLNKSFPKGLPQWINYDKRVMRFYGYFCEHVVVRAYENYWMRKCNIFYYLDDDIMHIDEVREENSGIVQVYFIKRQRYQKEDQKGLYISWRDFNLRIEIFFLEKNLEFVIVMILLNFFMLNITTY